MIFWVGGSVGFEFGIDVGGDGGGVVVEVGVGLFEMCDVFGFVLVLKYVGVIVFFVVIDVECVVVENDMLVWVLIEFLKCVVVVMFGVFSVDCVFVGVVLMWIVFFLDGGIDGVFIDVDDVEDVLGCFGFVSDDVLIEY